MPSSSFPLEAHVLGGERRLKELHQALCASQIVGPKSVFLCAKCQKMQPIDQINWGKIHHRTRKKGAGGRGSGFENGDAMNGDAMNDDDDGFRTVTR